LDRSKPGTSTSATTSSASTRLSALAGAAFPCRAARVPGAREARGRFVARDHVQELCLAGIRLRAFLFGLCRHRPRRHQSSYRYTVTSESGP
jgi:hypothetical protein